MLFGTEMVWREPPPPCDAGQHLLNPLQESAGHRFQQPPCQLHLLPHEPFFPALLERCLSFEPAPVRLLFGPAVRVVVASGTWWGENTDQVLYSNTAVRIELWQTPGIDPGELCMIR